TAKRLGAELMALLFFRPRRLDPTLASNLRRILLVRVDNRIGEALLMTPLLSTLRSDPRTFEVSILTHEKIARVLEGHPAIDRLYTIDPRKLWSRPWDQQFNRLRKETFDLVVDCTNWETPSVTSAILSRAISPRTPVVGPAAPPCGGLRDIAVAPLTFTK